MSHFTVLVIGNNPEKQLAPYQENNMGDCPGEFMEFESVEEEYLKQYNEDSTTKVIMPDGRMLNTWDNEFRKPGTFGMGTSTHEPPPHLERREVKFTDLYPTFEEYMNDWCGYEERDPEHNQFGSWRNPNSKWDWYLLGGRWTGFFKLKEIKLLNTKHAFDAFMGFTGAEIQNLVEMAKEDNAKFLKVVSKYKGKEKDIKAHIGRIIATMDDIILPNHEIGEPGLMTKEAKRGTADQCLRKYVDFDGMRASSVDKAVIAYDKAFKVIGHLPVNETWKSVGERMGYGNDEARPFYFSQPRLQAWKLAQERKEVDIWDSVDDFAISREEYLTNAFNNAISTFAFIKDGKWVEKGQMGWWATVSNEQDQSTWAKEFNKMMDELPDDTLLSLYDCHI